MTTNDSQIPCHKIISGGQTGVDRAALDVCLQQNFRCGGWCPKGRKAEDGVIPTKYPLVEISQSEYHYRTKLNVLDSDGTLIISPTPLKGGTLLTQQFATEIEKPILIVSEKTNPEEIFLWLTKNNIKVLNIAGPRQSEWSEAYQTAYHLTLKLITKIKSSAY